MNALTRFLQADWAERAGWTLLHSLWQIAAVAAVYVIAAFMLRNRSANARYVLGCIAMAAMLGLPIGTYSLLPYDVPREAAGMNNAPTVVVLPVESPPRPSDLTKMTVVSAGSLPPATPGDSLPTEPVPAKVTVGAPVEAETEVDLEGPATTDRLSQLRGYLPWATAVWLAGVTLLSLRPLWGWFHVRRLTRGGLSPLSDALLRAGQRVAQRLRVHRAVRFAQSALVEVPTVIGCLRPMILLPASAISGLSTAQIELILAHELAHIRRNDWLVNIAQTVIEALLFYHPGMWWVSSQIRKERENCCDDVAVAVGGNRTVYVRALAQLEEHRSPVPASVLGATGGSLLGRARRLLGKPNHECGSTVAGAWLVALATLFVVVVLATGYVRALGEADDSSEDESAAAADDEAEDFVSAYKGPCDVAASPDGKRLYVVERDACALAVVSVANGKVVETIRLPGEPSGVCVSPDGKAVYVTCGVASGLLCVIDTASGKMTAKLPVGHSPRGPSLSPDGKRVYVCSRFDNSVSVVDLVAKKRVARVNVLREPFDSAITPDGKTLFVTHHLPIDRAISYDVACEVTCIDTSTLQAKQIRMRNGDTNLSGVCVSPDGKYAYVVSVLARYQMPRTQLDRGWAVTNALSIIDARKKEYVNTVLLDDIDLGAANPYDVATSADASTLYVSHVGTHEVSVIDAKSMLEKLLTLPANRETLEKAGLDSQPTAEDVPNDLAFLRGMRKRILLDGLGPRGLAIVGNKAYCAMYFSDTLDCVDTRGESQPTVSRIRLGPKPVMSERRKGQLYFQDARLCFQQWLSCATCHPDGRTDGLNWDLLSDGLGNPKATKSMLLAHRTPPMMISGARADAEAAVRAAFRHVQFEVVPGEKAKAVDAYLKSLEPMPSPYLVDGKLSESAQRGKALFEGDQVGCVTCHPAPLYTDLKMYDVGTRGQYDRRDTWDTPTLVECWRTGPYLHDGRYATMKEVFSQGNHGEASDKLTDAEIDDLTAFVLSLSVLPADEKPREKSADNPLGLDDDTLIRLYYTGKALRDAAWNCASYYRRHDRMPEEVSEEDPFAPGENLRVVPNEETPGLVQIWGVGPDGDWDGGRRIDSTQQPLDGDLGVEMNRDTRSPRKHLADDVMVRHLEGGRLSHYLAAKGLKLPEPQLTDDGLKWGPAVDGLQLAVELLPKKEAYYLGEKIDVRFRVRNVADYEIMVGLTTNYHRELASNSVFIHDQNGNRLRGTSTDLMGLTGIRHQTLKPGETVSYDSADFALVAPGRRASGWPLAHQAEAAPGVYTAQFTQHPATSGSEPREWVGELETAPVTIRIAEHPNFALHRVAAYVDRSGSSTHILGLRDSGNGPERDAMRLKKHRLDDLVLDGVPLVAEQDIASYDWGRHILQLTPEAHERLTKSIKPESWGVPFVVQVRGEPVYQGTFRTVGSKYSTAMPAISLDLPDDALPEDAIRIEAPVPEEGETPEDPRKDERIHGALQATSRLVDLRSESSADSVAKKKLPALKARVVDKEGQPIADASVLCYDGNNFWAGEPVDFAQISKRTDKNGWANLGTLPQDYVCVQVNGRKDAFRMISGYVYEGEKGFVLTDSHPQIEIESDGQTVSLVFTMRRHVDLDFEVVDSETGKPVWWPMIYFEDEQRKRWWTLSLIDAGGQHDFATIVEELSDAQFRVAARGYHPVEFRLDERLELGKKATHRIEMKPAPEIRFTVLTPEGKPAEGVRFKYVNPEDLPHSLRKAIGSDSSGGLTVGYPAQGDLAGIELTHESGKAVVAVKDLPEPTTVTENEKRKEAILCEIRLSPPEAEKRADPPDVESSEDKSVQDIQVQLSPGIFRDGQQWLSVTVRNNSSDMSARLEPGGFPAELLVDNVVYRSKRVYIPPPRRSGAPRIIKPGKTNYGAEFTLHKDWVTVDEPKGIPLKPGKHPVRAIVYATGEDSEDGGDRVRLLSNPVEIGADGRAEGSREVRIRVLGGAEKKPLRDIKLTLMPSGHEEGITATTQEDGGASFKLPAGSYRVGIVASEELPYLFICSGWTSAYVPYRDIQVPKTSADRSVADAQPIDVTLLDPCELVLRAVDVETGRGVPGVAFATEGADDNWAQPIPNTTLRPPMAWKSDNHNKEHESCLTDEQGYVRRLVGPRPMWCYFVWSTPPGYELVKPEKEGETGPSAVKLLDNGRRNYNSDREEVKIETPLGKKRAEHTFLIRRTRSAAEEAPDDPEAEKKPLPTLKVHVRNEDRKPIPGISVMVYDRNHYMAGMPVDFKHVYGKTGEDGWAKLAVLPQEFLCVQAFGRQHTLGNGQTRKLDTAYVVLSGDRSGGFQQANPDKPMATMELDRKTNTLAITFTMRQGVELEFKALDAETGKEVYYTGVFYRDEQRNRWWHPVLLDGSGGQHNFWPMTEDLSDKPFRMASPGYYPVDFKLNEKLELGKPHRREIKLTPAPNIRFTVLTPDGEPAEKAQLMWIHPEGLGNITFGEKSTDADGLLDIPYPAQGELTSLHFTHASGNSTIAMQNLPKAMVVREDGESKDVIPCRIRLTKAEACRPSSAS